MPESLWRVGKGSPRVKRSLWKGPESRESSGYFSRRESGLEGAGGEGGGGGMAEGEGVAGPRRGSDASKIEGVILLW